MSEYCLKKKRNKEKKPTKNRKPKSFKGRLQNYIFVYFYKAGK